MDLLRDPIWQFIGVAVAIILAIVPFIYYHIRQRLGKNLGNMDSTLSTSYEMRAKPTKSTKTSKDNLDLHQLRLQIDQLYDDPSFDAFCLEHFPEVYNRFSQGMRRDSKVTLLLDYCRRTKDRLKKLASLLNTIKG